MSGRLSFLSSSEASGLDSLEVPRGSDRGWSLIDAWSRVVERPFSGLG